MTIENPKQPKHPNAKIPDECPGCDKEQHKQRSAFWQPNHLKHHEKGYKAFEDASYGGFRDDKVGS